MMKCHPSKLYRSDRFSTPILTPNKLHEPITPHDKRQDGERHYPIVKVNALSTFSALVESIRATSQS